MFSGRARGVLGRGAVVREGTSCYYSQRPGEGQDVGSRIQNDCRVDGQLRKDRGREQQFRDKDDRVKVRSQEPRLVAVPPGFDVAGSRASRAFSSTPVASDVPALPHCK